MPNGVVLTPDRTAPNLVDDAIAQAKAASDAGVRQVWLAQRFDFDSIALGAPAIESQAFGLSFDKPVRRLREYLTVLRSIFHDGIADFHGEPRSWRSTRPCRPIPPKRCHAG